MTGGLLLKMIILIAGKLLSSRACVLFRITAVFYESFSKNPPTIFPHIANVYTLFIQNDPAFFKAGPVLTKTTEKLTRRLRVFR